MSTAREWHEVLASDAMAFAKGKTVEQLFADEFDRSTQTNFTDGSALRVTWERGRVYSEHTSDPDYVLIEVSHAEAVTLSLNAAPETP